jgi:hypothetical protein
MAGSLEKKEKQQDKAKQAYAFYVSQGWSPEQAIGIVGNLLHESNFNTSATRDSEEEYSQGIAQWNGARLKALKNRYGKNWTDFRNQLEFVDWELKNTEKAAGDKLKTANGVWEAGRVVSDYYERPKVKFNSDDRRQGLVADMAMQLKGIKVSQADLPKYNSIEKPKVGKVEYTNDVNNFVYTPKSINFESNSKTAPLPEVDATETKSEAEKEVVEEAKNIEKETDFLQEVEKQDYAHLLPQQTQQQQQAPQVNYNQIYAQVSQFVDNPVAQQGGKYSENELAFLSEIAQQGGIPISPRGLYDYPKQEVIVPTTDGRITMKGISYDVLGIDDFGNKKVMKPNGEYKFKGKTIHEIPLFKNK